MEEIIKQIKNRLGQDKIKKMSQQELQKEVMNEIINEKSKSATKTSSNNTPLTQLGKSLPSASKFTDYDETKHDRRQ
jgi:uncharacterized membrane-anchored protein